MRALIKHGANARHVATDVDNGSTLHYAAVSGDADIVDALCDAGADPGALNAMAQSPLHAAVWAAPAPDMGPAQYVAGVQRMAARVKAGSTVQLEPRCIGSTPWVETAGFQCLKLKCGEPLSNLAFAIALQLPCGPTARRRACPWTPSMAPDAHRCTPPCAAR